MQTISTGFYPFWFWNAELSASEVRRQIQCMSEQGIKGFLIHPRQGLRQPYLADAFFEMVEVAVEDAGRCGLLVNLYDEYPYPSGIAGGEVTLGHPELWATDLKHARLATAGGRVRWELPPGDVLFCRAFPCPENNAVDWSAGLDLRAAVGVTLSVESYKEAGLTAYNRKRYFASHPIPVLDTILPVGRWSIHAALQTVVEGHKYWDRFPDVLHPETARRFLELTHERYARRFREHFGSRIASIFIDETQPGWSAQLPALFQARYAYDLLGLLPALAQASHPDHARVRHDL